MKRAQGRQVTVLTNISVPVTFYVLIYARAPRVYVRNVCCYVTWLKIELASVRSAYHHGKRLKIDLLYFSLYHNNR